MLKRKFRFPSYKGAFFRKRIQTICSAVLSLFVILRLRTTVEVAKSIE